MSDNSMVVQLGLDLSKLEHGLNKSNELMEGFHEKVKELGAGLAAAFTVEKIIEFGKESFELASKFEDNMTRMKFAVHGNSEELEFLKENAEELARTTYFSGEDIIQQETRLAVMGRTEEQIKSLLKAATAMSAAFGIDLETSVNALNKSLNGVGKALVNIDPSFKELTVDELKNGDAIELAISKYGDLAEELNNNASASIKNASKQWEEFKKNLGNTTPIKLAADALGSFFHSLSVNLTHVKDTDDHLKDLNAALKTYNNLSGDGIKGQLLTNAYDKLKEAAEAAGKQVVILTDGVKTLAFLKPEPIKFVDGNKLPEAAKEVKNIAYYEQQIKEAQEEEKKLIGPELTAQQQKIEGLKKELQLLEMQWDIIRDISETAKVKKMSTRNEDVKDSALAGGIIPPSENIDKATAAMNKMQAALDKIKGQSGQYKKSFADIFDEEKIKHFTVAIHDGLSMMITELAAGLGELASNSATTDEIFATLLTGVGNMAIRLGELAIGVGIGIGAIKEALETLNPVTAIAAGVALVALGSAVKGAAAGIGKGGSGGGESLGRSTRRNIENFSQGGSYNQGMAYNIKIKGEDLWVVLSNYQTNSKFMKLG